GVRLENIGCGLQSRKTHCSTQNVHVMFHITLDSAQESMSCLPFELITFSQRHLAKVHQLLQSRNLMESMFQGLNHAGGGKPCARCSRVRIRHVTNRSPAGSD